MARFVFRRYSDDARAIDNVLTFCVEENNMGMKLFLDRVWGRTAALTGIGRSSAQRIVQEKKNAREKQQQPKQPP